MRRTRSKNSLFVKEWEELSFLRPCSFVLL